MPSFGFNFRASTRKEGGAGRLYLRVVHGSESRSVTTGYKVMPEDWDAVGRRLIIPYGRSSRSRQLIDIESSMMCDLRRMDSVIRELERDGPFTIDQLMMRYRAAMTGNTFCAFIEKLATETHNNRNIRTVQTYRIAAARLRAFNGGKDLNPEHITQAMIGDFQQFLKAEGCSMNTISFYMRTLRSIYHKAIAEGHIHRSSEDPFAGVYTGISTTRKLALSSSDLAALSALDPTVSVRRAGVETLPDHLGQALAMFLFCYHARGMCFVDMANLKKSDLRGDVIRYRRHKTGQAIELKMLPAMQRIIDWFGPYTAGSRYLFPVITDPEKPLRLQYESGLRLQNQRLKKVARLCGVSTKFSTHCARHSWATVAKSAGLPLAVISEGLGHTNQRTTEIYLSSLERSVIDQASRLVSDAIEALERPVRRSGRPSTSGRGMSGGVSFGMLPPPGYGSHRVTGW
jgi:site-specific recombinase XerD